MGKSMVKWITTNFFSKSILIKNWYWSMMWCPTIAKFELHFWVSYLIFILYRIIYLYIYPKIMGKKHVDFEFTIYFYKNTNGDHES